MDVLLDENFDLKIEDGDFAVGDDTEQRVMLILDAEQGHWKQWPAVGVGIRNMLNGSLTPGVNRNIRLQLKADGLNLSQASFENGNLSIELKR